MDKPSVFMGSSSEGLDFDRRLSIIWIKMQRHVYGTKNFFFRVIIYLHFPRTVSLMRPGA